VSLLEIHPIIESAHGRSTSTLGQRDTMNSTIVLEELFQLLEEYGPSWYTEEHHNRAVAALINS